MNKYHNRDDDHYNERYDGRRNKHPVGWMAKRARNARHSLLKNELFLRNLSFKVLVDPMRSSEDGEPLNAVIVPYQERLVHVCKDIDVAHERLQHQRSEQVALPEQKRSRGETLDYLGRNGLGLDSVLVLVAETNPVALERNEAKMLFAQHT